VPPSCAASASGGPAHLFLQFIALTYEAPHGPRHLPAVLSLFIQPASFKFISLSCFSWRSRIYDESLGRQWYTLSCIRRLRTDVFKNMGV